MQGRAWGNVLVHCNRGVSRSSSIIIAYLMKRKGLGLKEALEFTKVAAALALLLAAARTIANPGQARSGEAQLSVHKTARRV
jgi:predicted protein tyrosine phosphatase